MKLFLTLFILCLSLALNAQNDTWTYFAPPPDPSCQAARGNTILMGTIGAGIVRFDTLGNRTVFNTDNSGLPSDSVTYLVIDAAENWWMIHPGGIGRFDGTNTQTWTTAQIGLPVNTLVHEMKAAPDSSLYVASENGVAIFKNNSWSVLNTSNSGLPSNDVWDVAFGPDGKRYFATTGSGIVIQDGANWTSYTTANTGINTLNNVYAVAVTTDGVLWAIGGLSPIAGLRLAKFEAGTWTGFTPVSIGITPSAPFRKLTAGSAGQIYLTTLSTVSILQQGTWAHYRAQEIGCAHDAGIAPVEDGAGNIWIFTSCQLARFDGQLWSGLILGLPGPPDGTLFDGIAEGADGSIWMGTYEGGYIARLKDDDSWEQYRPANYGATNSRVTSIQGTPDGQMWFGLENSEILRYADGDWTFFDTCAAYFPNNFVITAAPAPNGDQWFSFGPSSSPPTAPFDGLARYSTDGQWQFFSAANAPLVTGYIRKILFEADGTAWFATTFVGILRFKNGVWETFTVSNSGLPSDRVFYLALAPDGAIWAATDSGLARFDGQNWTTLNTSNSGLPSDVTSRIAFDKAGGMYVGYVPATPGTPGARAVVLRGGVWTELVPPGWENSSNDELDAFFVDSQNRLWFAEFYDPGVYRYDPMLVSAEEPAAAPTRIFTTPNPTAGLLTLQLETPLAGEARLNVWNSLGQRVHTGIVSQTAGTTVQVDLSNLPAGVYRVHLLQKGGAAATALVVKR
ncbi:MAG TPA: T9SS type A sorting domain-containing protein [Saprospiraceae bacterium]|nr:T9SS type A sorting domain-containing protein [Saprospiraceae bacterium]